MPSFGIPCEPPDPALATELATAVTEYVNCLLSQLMLPLNGITSYNSSLINNITTTLGAPVTSSSSDIASLISSIQSLLAQPSTQSATNIVNIGPITENTYESSAATAEATATATADASAVSDSTTTTAPTEQPSETTSTTIDIDAGDGAALLGAAGDMPPEGSVNVLGAGDVEPEPPAALQFSAFTCPTNDKKLTKATGVIGTPEWCAAVEVLFDWLENIGGQIEKYVVDSSDLIGLRKYLASLFPPLEDKDIVSQIQRATILVLLKLTEVVRQELQTLIAIIQCAKYYSSLVMPVRRPLAYSSIVIIHNVITWVKGSRIGSQSYLGVTVSTNLTLPQLEEYLLVLQRYLCPMEFPSVSEVADAWRKQYITTDHRDCLLNLNGCNPVLWDQFIKASGGNISPREAIQWARREQLPFEGQVQAVMRTGISDPQVAGQMITLYDELPTIQDHLHWLQRNVFNDQYVKDYQLLNGFEERFWRKYGDDLLAQGYTKERAANEYAAHWIMPSPTQMREFIYRLRPDVMEEGAAFTVDDYKRILAEQDYNPLAAEWFANTIDRVLTHQQVKDLRANRLIDSEQHLSALRDLGYSATDAPKIRDNDAYAINRSRASTGHLWTPTAMAKAYAGGTMTAALVAEGMAFLGYQPNETTALLARATSDLQYTVTTRARSRLLSTTVKQVSAALKVGVMDVAHATQALTAIGWPQATAAGIAQLEASNAKTEQVKGAVRRLQSAFLAGEVDAAYCGNALTVLGIVPDAVQRYLATWRLEQTPRRKRRTAAQISNDVAEGNLDTATALVQLRNLGYDDADSRLFIADAQRDLIHTTAEAIKGVHFGGRGGVSILTQAGEKSVTLNKRIVAWLMRQEPPAKLLSWANAGVISPDYARNRLALYGWDESSIEKWVASIKPPKEKTPSTNGAAK